MNKENAAGVTAQNTEQPVKKKDAPNFSIAQLREHSIRLFGVTSSTFDGATAGLEGAFTVDAMKDHIKKWQSTAVLSKKGGS